MRTSGARRIGAALLLRLATALTVVVFAACNGDSGGDGIDLGEVSSALQPSGFELASSSNNSDTQRVALFIGGLSSDDETVASQLGNEFACRDEVYDSVFRINPRATANTLQTSALLIPEIRSALTALAGVGITDVSVIGHNTGGVIARAAVASSELEALPLKISLFTFFAPFHGHSSSTIRPGYTSELLSTSALIATPSGLPKNVTHHEVRADLSRPSLLFTGQEADAIFPTLQASSAIEAAAGERTVTTIVDPFWPFGFESQFRVALDELGLPENRCAEDTGASGNEIEGVREESLPRLARDLGTNSLAIVQGISFNKTTFAKSGLQAPTLSGDELDPTKPVVVMVHGVGGQNEHFDKLESDYTATHNVFRFVYDEGANSLGEGFAQISEDFSDDTDDLEEIADKFVSSVKLLRDQFGLKRITVIAHSMGGVIARRAMTTGRAQTLAEMGIEITFVSVASPFAGFDFANFNPIMWASSLFGTPGPFYARMASGSDFIVSPGQLGTNIHHLKIVTIEKGDPFAVPPSDGIVSEEDQSNPQVDNDSQLITGNGIETGIVSFKAGHVGVLTSDSSRAIVIRLTNLAEETVTSLIGVPPVPGNDGAGEETPAPSTPPSTPPPAAPPITPVAVFDCPDGSYSGTTGNCGVGTFSISSLSGSLVATGFPANSSVNFSGGDSSSRTATGVVIFSKGDHTCRMTCTNPAGPAISLTCTNSAGGQCTQGFAGN